MFAALTYLWNRRSQPIHELHSGESVRDATVEAPSRSKSSPRDIPNPVSTKGKEREHRWYEDEHGSERRAARAWNVMRKKRLHRFLVEILEKRTDEEILKGLGKCFAEQFVDLLISGLREGLISSPELERRAMRCLLCFTLDHGILPLSLWTPGVTTERFPRYGGGFADVYRGYLAGCPVAVKRLRLFTCDSQERKDKRERMLMREAVIWRTLNHRNILPLMGVFDEPESSRFLMISPWMENGNIVDLVASLNPRRRVIDSMLHGVASGLAYLHSRGLVHGDIRGANILVDSTLHACLTDFGLSRVADMTQTHSGTGSVRWMAPELHYPSAFGKEEPAKTQATDVFAYALLCVEVYSGQVPFYRLTDGAAILAIIRGERPVRPEDEDRPMSDNVWQRVTSYWEHQPENRPSIQLALTWDELEEPCTSQINASPPSSSSDSPTVHCYPDLAWDLEL
ncbi:kinase-like protein [Neolentinus lepideus HHB14362 ss-1]|uniref:Kinase-like protein n=1 Tax=Neolentinus lepideus HHB14362 ss-1 TaxID=1314782 RepID=A0A165MR74_9AGAM|nr:kinase-like protein [Neolentinus lepideus HHB14362 ss-1]